MTLSVQFMMILRKSVYYCKSIITFFLPTDEVLTEEHNEAEGPESTTLVLVMLDWERDGWRRRVTHVGGTVTVKACLPRYCQ